MDEYNKHVSAGDGKAYGTFQESDNCTPLDSSNSRVNDEVKKRPIVVPTLRVERAALTQVTLDNTCPPFRDEDTLHKKVNLFYKRNVTFSRACIAKSFTTIFPFLKWLPEYSIKNDLLIDLITGFTLLILHVPQGMAYAQLASVQPIYGLYTSFYPVLIYFFLGTSKHISMGTFAISSLLTGTEVDYIKEQEFMSQKATTDIFLSNATMTNATTILPTLHPVVIHSAIQIAMIITFTTGLLQTAMGLMRMGYLTSFMSDEMVSGFITGTVIHVFTSQLMPLTGGTFVKHSGAFNIILTWVELFSSIHTFNYIVLMISLCSITFLIIVKEIFNVLLQKFTRIPIPAELLLVVFGTLLSYTYSLNTCCDVAIVGLTPTGLKPPEVPPLELLPRVLTASMILSVVSASTTLSMVIIYAKKHEYQIDTNQELLSYGVIGLVTSFFYCIPSCASLSRSAVQDSMGAKSQVSSLVSCVLMLVVLLKLGPLFETLPNCMLSAIIVISLKSMLMHFGDLKRAWNASKLDASVWLVTFSSVVILDMDYGLIIGILYSLITILFRSQYPETCLLGNLPGTELYRSLDKYPNMVETPGIKIYHFGASLYFANRDYFRSQIFHLVSTQQSKKIEEIRYQTNQDCKEKSASPEDQLTFSKSFKYEDILKVIILELSAVGYIDSGGVATLTQVIKEFALNNITIYFACIQEPVRDNLESQRFFETFNEHYVFPTIHDAVLFAREHETGS